MNTPRRGPLPVIVVSDWTSKDPPKPRPSHTEPCHQERDGLETEKKEDSIKKEPTGDNVAPVKHKILGDNINEIFISSE